MRRTWWKESVVYQIYPRSFCDSNGDGIGDLRGIISKLDYLKELGVDVVWLSPVYQSPNDDNGYDISDYQDIMDEFGTLADWEELLAGMHQRGIKLVMDLVVNHTSDEHPWFVESRKSEGQPLPRLLHLAARQGRPRAQQLGFALQRLGLAVRRGDGRILPAPVLQKAARPELGKPARCARRSSSMMHWWLDKGVDGFRMDVINMISKAPGLPDAPVVTRRPLPVGRRVFHQRPAPAGVPARDEAARCSRSTTSSPWARRPLVTTAGRDRDHQRGDRRAEHGVPVRAHGPGRRPRAGVAQRQLQPWNLADLKQVMTRWQKELEGRGWNSLYLSNHDQPRPVSRFGDDGRYRVESAKMLATFLHMLQGTPYVYQGEEIGMTNVAFDSIEDYRDIADPSTCTASWWRKRASTRSSRWRSSMPRAATTPARRCSGMTARRPASRPARPGSRSTRTTRRSTSSRRWPTRTPSSTTTRS